MKGLSRLSRVSFLLGITAVLAASWLNRPGYWRPATLDTVALESDFNVVLQAGSEYEIALEANRYTDQAVLESITSSAPQTAVNGTWRITCDGNLLATGSTSDYLRVLAIRPTLGKIRRILGRVPFGQDETSYYSFGLAGNFLAERTIGRLQSSSDVDTTCTVQWRVSQPADGVRLSIRLGYDDWKPHYGAVSILAFGGFLLMSVGIALGLGDLIWQRRFWRRNCDLGA